MQYHYDSSTFMGKIKILSTAGVITKFIELLSKGSAPTIFGDGEQTRDFIHVSDVVDAIISAAETTREKKNVNIARNGEMLSNTFNVGTGCPISINSLANRLVKIFGLNLKPVFSEHEYRRDEALLR